MVSDSALELPFFPQYETEQLCDDKLRVTWFEPNFSQSHYNIHNTTIGSNACTLIAVLMAAKCHSHKILVNDPGTYLNLKLIHLFASSMLEGNKIHEDLKRQNLLKHINLNVPEALKFSKKQTQGLTEWKCEVFMEYLSESLYENILKTWREWIKLHSGTNVPDIYIILVSDSRTILLIIQMDSATVTLLDSHQHCPDKGAVIATAKLSKFKQLCHWYIEVLLKYYNSDPKLYELSFLYFYGT